MSFLSLQPGVLNVHFWDGFCGSRVEDLKRNIHFPYYPSERGNITKFFTQRYETGFGQRIFGYLHPPETGVYKLVLFNLLREVYIEYIIYFKRESVTSKNGARVTQENIKSW